MYSLNCTTVRTGFEPVSQPSKGRVLPVRRPDKKVEPP
ncbi:hypothetical protein [Enterococcus phage PEF1]